MLLTQDVLLPGAQILAPDGDFSSREPFIWGYATHQRAIATKAHPLCSGCKVGGVKVYQLEGRGEKVTAKVAGKVLAGQVCRDL